MKARGITQSQLATALNCTQTAVSNILSSKTRLTVDDMAKIASALGMPPDELIAEALDASRAPVNLSEEAENTACANNLAFYLVHRLKKPVSEDDLIQEFDPKAQNSVRQLIADFRKHNLLVEDLSGNLRLLLPDPSMLQFRLTPAYTKRTAEIYSNLRPVILDVIKTPDQIREWKERNFDSFYAEYFTDDQIKQQNQVFRQAIDLVKHHIRMNRNPSGNGLRDDMELRVVFATTAPYPSDILRDGDNND